MSDQVSKITSDQASKNTDNQLSTDGAAKILSEQSKENLLSGDSQKLQIAAATNAMVGPILPDITITGNDTTSDLFKLDPRYMSDEDGSFGHFVGDVLNVANIVREGAWKEITEHPVDLAITAAETAGIAIVATFLAPEVAAIAIGAGIGYGLGQVINHMGGWMHDADVVTRPEDYTDQEIATAHQDLEGIGAGGAHLLAGTIGGFAAKPLMMAGEGLLSALTSEATTTLGVSAESAMGATVDSAAGSVLDGTIAPAAADATTTAAADVTTTAAADATSTSTAEFAVGDSAVQGSVEAIARDQDIFRAAQSNDAIQTVTKRTAPITLEKIGPEGVPSTNPLDPEGTIVPEGNWLLRDYSPDGSTQVHELAINKDWVLKTFDVTPEQLAENSKFAISYNPDHIPKQMVELPDGRWLVNSDFDAATGVPGKSFYTIPGEQFDMWYNPNTAPAPFVHDPSLPVISGD